jgi:tRNA threonylcarbamoyladenosine modification (KEOPS) complex  Pcc1 subunit
MKFFRCQNEECSSFVPRGAKENNVLAAVTLIFPMLPSGEIDYDGQPKLSDIDYTCGICGDTVEEMEGRDLVRCRITEAKESVILGEFQSYGRGNGVYHFAYNISSKEVQVKEGIKLWDHEMYYILEFCEDVYAEHAIRVVLLDYDPNSKTYSVQVTNLAERVVLDVEATDREILGTSGRELNSAEKKKVFKIIESTPF